ncbi:TIM44-like domain-containing protein [Polyangium sp. y55x31]|uniref:TIM44-like domain-containing protein n=1 Tax=Polyangium sp. y55x31 TaxID=3042688 RepID=UPI002482BFD6|nr:TIM44-like domain-containing protein [Polyangium sp. y55x31]MDI1479035.1 TIM44-like domain-containing protein [Polyangium sp. y55x31]
MGAIFFVASTILQKQRELERGWESSLPDPHEERMQAARRRERERKQAQAQARRRNNHSSIESALRALGSKDTNFSRVLFEDFLYALYAEVQAARGKGTLDALGSYLAEGAIAAYSPYPAAEVRDVVIGAMRFEAVVAQSKPVRRIELVVGFEVNYTEVSAEGEEQSFWVSEKWRLVRDPDVKSRPPEKTRLFGCPNCGAPQDKSIGSKCPYCGAVASTGELDWTVFSIDIEAREPRGPMLTGTTEEVGTDLPTIVAPDTKSKWSALTEKDPDLRWSSWKARVEAIFQAFHEGWSSQNLALVRPYLSDHLFQSQHYWIDTYRKQKLRNITEDARIISIDLARVLSDAHYDAVTVRIFASCRDYTVDGDGKVVAGSETKERAYSEYWTLIRGAERRGTPRVDPVCPNCGAPNAKINMSGACSHCKAHITAGEFDWVLSRIEQDEVYRG